MLVKRNPHFILEEKVCPQAINKLNDTLQNVIIISMA